LQWTKRAGLRVMDGRGDYPIHLAIKKRLPKLAMVLVEHDVEVLYWENATGHTGLDLLDRMYQRETIHSWELVYDDIRTDYKEAESAYRELAASARFDNRPRLREYSVSQPRKRKLVSVVE